LRNTETNSINIRLTVTLFKLKAAQTVKKLMFKNILQSNNEIGKFQMKLTRPDWRDETLHPCFAN
jgi:hypothetical protein